MYQFSSHTARHAASSSLWKRGLPGAHRGKFKALRLSRRETLRCGARFAPRGCSGEASATPERAPRPAPPLWAPHPDRSPLGAPAASAGGWPHLQEVATLTVDGDQVVVDGDELLGLGDEEGGAVQLRPVGGEGELAREAQHVQAPCGRASGGRGLQPPRRRPRAARLTCPVPGSAAPSAGLPDPRGRAFGSSGTPRWDLHSTPAPAMPGASCPSAEPKLATSPLPADAHRQPRLTQSAAVQRLPSQLPLQVGAEEQERVVVRRFPQLAKKMSQSGEVQEVGKGTGSGALCLPHSKENKVAGSTSPASKEEKGLDPFRQTGASPGAKGRTRASSAKRQGGRPAKGKPGEGRGKRQGRKS